MPPILSPLRFPRHVLIALLAILLGTGPLAGLAVAQEATPDATPAAQPEATPAATADPATVATLFDVSLDEFPQAPVSIRLLRMTLAPGASSPLHTHPGPEFDYVESGTLTATAEGDATVVRNGEEAPAEATETLGEGEMIVFPAGTGMSLVNEGDTDLILLSAVFHPISEGEPSTTYPDGEPAADAFEGVSFTVLGDGFLQEFPQGPATITLDRITAPAGSDLPGAEGAALYSAVAGNFSFAVASGDVQVTRTASPQLRPNAVPDQEFTLATGDAAFFPAGVSTIARADETDTVELLRLAATPAEALGGEPASVTYIPASEASDAATEDAPSDGTTADTASTELGVGATVVTTDETVNLREEPTIEADGVDQLGEGVELEIVGGPEEADDFTWYEVEVVGTDGSTGWIVDDFIALPGEEPEEPAEAAGTPQAGTVTTPEAADNETFAEGDTVVTNDENVRLRAEPAEGSDILDAFPAGTEFVITGEPEEADGFTWYPVQSADDEELTGWIVEDFLDAAE